MPLAYATPPDSVCVAGIYDAADFDDVVALLADSRMARASAPVLFVGFLIFLERVPLPVVSRRLLSPPFAPHPRAPPAA